MLTQLFTEPKSKPAKRLAELGARRRELLTRERDELARLERARDEHSRLSRVIADSEAKALALGQDTAEAKGAAPKRDRLAQEIETHTATSDQLGRAILTLDEEAGRIVMADWRELLAEAVAQHDRARDRVGELSAELRKQAAALRAAYVAAQAILSAAGHSTHTGRLRVVPGIETLASEGGAPPLIHEDDRLTLAA